MLWSMGQALYINKINHCCRPRTNEYGRIGLQKREKNIRAYEEGSS
jgi:hypothetical protein